MTGVVDLTLCNDDHSFDPVDPLAVPLEHRSPLFQSNSIESKRFESVSPVLFHVCRHHPPVYGSTEIEFKNVSSSFQFISAGTNVSSIGHSPRLLAAVWCLCTVVFIYVYVGILVSFLSVPKLRPIVNSLEDLRTSPIDWGVRHGTATESYFTVTREDNGQFN